MQYLNKSFTVYLKSKKRMNHCMSLSRTCFNSGAECLECTKVQGKYTNYKKELHSTNKSAKSKNQEAKGAKNNGYPKRIVSEKSS